MNRATALRAVGYGATAVPFAFGAFRFASTGSDLRYEWMALAAFVAAELGLRSRTAATMRPVTLGRVVLVMSMVVAYAAAYAAGARNTVSMTIMSVSFGTCFALGAALRRAAATSETR